MSVIDVNSIPWFCPFFAVWLVFSVSALWSRWREKPWAIKLQSLKPKHPDES